jgi:glycosyltransferase involved in cell wall biosynthesis
MRVMSSKTRAPVSVIVSTYNHGRFIGDAINSILAQTVEPEQIIIVDDGSTDDTELAVRRYKDPSIEYIKQTHAGAAAARNTGLNAARGEFVTFLDADDRWGPEFVERLHDFLAEDATAVCAFSNFVWFSHETGKIVRDQFPAHPELHRPVLLKGVQTAFARIPRERAFSVLIACNQIPAHMQVMMFRRASIESLRFDSSLVLGYDTNFALQTFLEGAVIFTDEVLAEVRLYDTSAADDAARTAVLKLKGLQALESKVSRTVDLAAYHERVIKAHIEAALYQTSAGRVRAGLRSWRDSLRVPGSPLRKLKAALRLVFALPRGLAK